VLNVKRRSGNGRLTDPSAVTVFFWGLTPTSFLTPTLTPSGAWRRAFDFRTLTFVFCAADFAVFAATTAFNVRRIVVVDLGIVTLTVDRDDEVDVEVELEVVGVAALALEAVRCNVKALRDDAAEKDDGLEGWEAGWALPDPDGAGLFFVTWPGPWSRPKSMNIMASDMATVPQC